MKRTLLTMMLFLFLASILFPLPKCLVACPFEISAFEVKNEPTKEARHSQKPCCAKKNDAPQKQKYPASCPLLLTEFQPKATATLLKTVPDLQPSIHSLDSFPMVSVYHSRILWADGAPANARSMPIILEKQSFLI
jgi:hypothetical protein